MRAKICTVAVNMTGYPSVRKPALDAPKPIGLEFARDRFKDAQNPPNRANYIYEAFKRIGFVIVGDPQPEFADPDKLVIVVGAHS